MAKTAQMSKRAKASAIRAKDEAEKAAKKRLRDAKKTNARK